MAAETDTLRLSSRPSMGIRIWADAAGRYLCPRHDQKNYAKLKKAYLVSYDRAVATFRQADHCITCGECLSHCPQSINIPKQLTRIATYIDNLKQDKL